MWLVLDMGNSAVKGGFFDGTQLHDVFRLAYDTAAAAPIWQEALLHHAQRHPTSRIGIASVVPTRTAHILARLQTLNHAQILHIQHTLTLPFHLNYQTPDTLGTDRLAAAAAAWTRFSSRGEYTRAVVAVDAGTAITYEVIDRQGVYRGGAIAAGPRLLRDALSQGTAQLPAVPLQHPATAVGRSTVEALQAGIMLGFLDSVSGMLERVADDLNEQPFVVATGGWASLLQQHLPAIDHIEPHLVLLGITDLMQRNASTSANY